MSRISVCVVYPDAMPSRQELLDLNVDTVRIFTYSLDQLDAALSILGEGFYIFVTVNNQWAECGWDFSNWINFIGELGRRFQGRIHAVGLINEPDIWHLQPPVGDPDPMLTPSWCADRIIEAAAPLYGRGIQPVISSVASGQWEAYLAAMTSFVKPRLTVPIWADLHLYVKSAGGVPNNPSWQTMQAALGRARAITGMPVVASEAGIKVHDAGGEDAQAQWVTNFANTGLQLSQSEYPMLSLFCWSDRAGSPGETWDHGFGLRRPDHSKRPSWDALQEVLLGSGGPSIPNPGPSYQRGFLTIARVHPDLLGQPLHDEVFPRPGAHIATQRTEFGLLYWTRAQSASNARNFFDIYGFTDYVRGGDYIWSGTRLERTT